MQGIKIRNPIAVFFLGVITLGIYYIYWFYAINSEAAIIANDRKAKPGLSLLAVTLGALLIVPWFWSHWTTAARVGKATGSPATTLGNLVCSILLAPFVSIVYVFWVQGKMNRYAREHMAGLHTREPLQQAPEAPTVAQL